MRPIAGKSVMVTGGGSGIGEGIARHFVRLGARVTICGRRLAKITAVADSLGPLCHAVQADVTSVADRARLVDEAVAHGGGIESLVNAAGNMYRGPLEGVDEAEMLGLFHSNVVGPVQLVRDTLAYLKASRGSVVFFGSVHTQRAFPGASPYAATKGALETLTGVLAAELGLEGVRVNCLRPGAVFTELNVRAGLGDETGALERLRSLSSAHALGRIGTVEEMAEAVEFLVCSEWTTGSILTVDGGLALGVTQA